MKTFNPLLLVMCVVFLAPALGARSTGLHSQTQRSLQQAIASESSLSSSFTMGGGRVSQETRNGGNDKSFRKESSLTTSTNFDENGKGSFSTTESTSENFDNGDSDAGGDYGASDSDNSQNENANADSDYAMTSPSADSDLVTGR